MFLILPSITSTATLSISPNTGTFSVGSTFNASLLLNTSNQSINALSISLKFPPDMLQIVSPSTGESVIGVWTVAPKWDNKTGKIELQGGIPGGITASSGLVTTFTFRVKTVGEAVVKFLDNSKVLLNDGLGTDVLTQTQGAIYQTKLPAPAGPTVVSETNPNQALWYQDKTTSFYFTSEISGIEGYSYLLSDNPTTAPDDISEGMKNTISYPSLSDGIHYFHIKALRDGIWGGTTHFSVKIDSTPPADFKIIIPSTKVSRKQPIIQFSTTDSLSGVSHYELKLIPLSDNSKVYAEEDNNTKTFFIEEASPYIPPELDLGSYDVIVRAYDKSNNYTETTERFILATPIFLFVTNNGINLGNFILSWSWTFVILAFILGLFFLIFYRSRRWHHHIHKIHKEKKLPEDVDKQIKELKKYKEKYGKIAMFIVFLVSSFMFHGIVLANNDNILTPPVITSISKNISNREIFYVGGKTNFANEEVIIYLQNLTTGEIFNQSIKSDKKGDWLYTHDNFLSSGDYLLWTQSKLGNKISSESSQITMHINQTAIELNGRSISYRTIYFFIFCLLLIFILILSILVGIYFYHGYRKHKEIKKYIKKTEESIKKEFATLHKDITAELLIVKKAKLSGSLSEEEQSREKELLDDLNRIQKQIGADILEFENI